MNDVCFLSSILVYNFMRALRGMLTVYIGEHGLESRRSYYDDI